LKLAVLVGSGRKVGLFTAPFLVPGIILNVLFPPVFSVGGPSPLLKVISIAMLVAGVIIWLWSVILILVKVPQKKLITDGPYSLMKHPLYTGVALFVIPSFGFLINTWLGLVIGMIVYVGSRMFSPEEEKMLAKIFGAAWDDYCKKVVLPWL
jgi:protein-S-isoprenylcysteine O-methyltransferase Ste14